MSFSPASSVSSAPEHEHKHAQSKKQPENHCLCGPAPAEEGEESQESHFPFLLFALGFTPYAPGATEPSTEVCFEAEYLPFDTSHLSNRTYTIHLVQQDLPEHEKTENDKFPHFEDATMEGWFDQLMDPKSNFYPWEAMYTLLGDKVEAGELNERDFRMFEAGYMYYKGNITLSPEVVDGYMSDYKVTCLNNALAWIVAVDHVWDFVEAEKFIKKFGELKLPMVVEDLEFTIIEKVEKSSE